MAYTLNHRKAGKKRAAFALILCCTLLLLHASISTTQQSADKVSLIALEDADCASRGGKLIALQNTDQRHAFKVWVDRWFLAVKTADHTSHTLLPEQPPVQLGCSITVDGDAQHWTLDGSAILTSPETQ